MKYGSPTSSLYFFGTAYTPYNSFLSKQSSTNTVIWSKIYTEEIVPDAFDVDSSETNIYFSHISASYFPLNVVNAANGALLTTLKLSSLNSLAPSFCLRLQEGTSMLFFVAADANYQGVLCRTDTSSLGSAV